MVLSVNKCNRGPVLARYLVTDLNIQMNNVKYKKLNWSYWQTFIWQML